MTFLPVAVGGFGVAFLIAYVLLRTPARDPFKYLLIAALLGGSTFVAGWMAETMGYAVPVELPPKARLLGYNVVLKDSQKVGIEMWLKAGDTRLYVIPYSKEAEKALKELKGKQGIPIIKGKKRGQGQGDKPEFETDILTPNKEIPKDAEPEVEAPSEKWDRSSI